MSQGASSLLTKNRMAGSTSAASLRSSKINALRLPPSSDDRIRRIREMGGTVDCSADTSGSSRIPRSCVAQCDVGYLRRMAPTARTSFSKFGGAAAFNAAVVASVGSELYASRAPARAGRSAGSASARRTLSLIEDCKLTAAWAEQGLLRVKMSAQYLQRRTVPFVTCNLHDGCAAELGRLRGGRDPRELYSYVQCSLASPLDAPP